MSQTAATKTSIWAKAKKHPYMTGAIVFVVGAALIFIIHSLRGGGQAQASSGGQDAAYWQAQLQSEALAAQQSAQTQQISAAAAAQTGQVNGAVAINTQNDQAAVNIAALQAQTQQQIASYEASLGTIQSNNTAQTNQLNISTAGNVQLAGIQEQGTVQLAGINASTQQAQIASSTQLGLGQQETGLLQSLINGLFSKPATPPTYQGNVPGSNGSWSAGQSLQNANNWINGLPSNTLLTQQQVHQLLAGQA